MPPRSAAVVVVLLVVVVGEEVVGESVLVAPEEVAPLVTLDACELLSVYGPTLQAADNEQAATNLARAELRAWFMDGDPPRPSTVSEKLVQANR